MAGCHRVMYYLPADLSITYLAKTLLVSQFFWSSLCLFKNLMPASVTNTDTTSFPLNITFLVDTKPSLESLDLYYYIARLQKFRITIEVILRA